MRSMSGILVDVAGALLILIISGAIFNQIAGVEEGETAPAWVGILPLVLSMAWLLWRTSRRRRARAEEEAANAPVELDEPPEMRDSEDRWSDLREEREEARSGAALSEFEWRSRVESLVRNLEREAFERFTLRVTAALELTDVRVERIAFDGAVEAIGREASPDGRSVYVICRRSFGAMGRNQIRDLRQQMEGKADEGLFICNGEFSSSAVSEADEGEPPIELIDGDELIDLMQEHAMGVVVDVNGDVIEVDQAWFRALDDA